MKNEDSSHPLLDATEDYTSDCCDAPFGYPGWPDSDICSKCFEHADLGDNNV